MGVSVVITSGKGGVGKSTVAVGLGRALVSRGRRVLLVDGDAGLRSLDRMTGTEESLVFDCADVVHGRCSPAEAIYPCRDTEGLFLLPAPSSGEEAAEPRAMGRLVPVLKACYDYVLLDSPAGVGRGFRAAAAGADRALLVTAPDPVCIRGVNTVSRLLNELGVSDQRLVINRFNGEFFRRTGAFADLDGVIDAVGVRLLGLVPEDFGMAGAILRGDPPEDRAPGAMALHRVAARLEGEEVPLPDKLR